jgi:hypothetical protein
METANFEKLGFAHYRIYTDILINASPAQVWQVLTDTRSYQDWAAFMVKVEGAIKDEQSIQLTFQLNPNKEKFNQITHSIHVTEGVEFYWAEKGPLGICDNHHFRIEPTANGHARFIQTDEITKGMTWLLGGKLVPLYLQGYQAFNQALKSEAEQRFAQQPRSA